ncbi:MAG: OmpA family protein [Terriglobales bacterium]
MSRRHKRVRHVNHDRWLISYADFITLLFAFFVVLYASSQVDKRKVGKLALAIQVAFQEMGVFEASTTKVPMNPSEPMPFSTVQAIENIERNASLGRIASHPEGELGGGRENGDLAQLQAALEKSLAGEIKLHKIAVRRDADGVVISLHEAGFFESGSAQMKATSQATFDRIANLLRRRDCYIRVEGHTDNIPIHNSQFSSNWVLSVARATEVVRLLIGRDGYSPDRLSAAGYAEFHPIASNATAEGRSLNRRVDIVILRQGPAAQATTAPATIAQAPARPATHATNSRPTGPLTATRSAKPSPTIGPKPLPASGISTPR